MTTLKSYLVYPVYADGVTFTSNASGTSWGGFDSWTTIVPANTITTSINLCGVYFQFGSATISNPNINLLSFCIFLFYCIVNRSMIKEIVFNIVKWTNN
jgi:hypothetical protein